MFPTLELQNDVNVSEEAFFLAFRGVEYYVYIRSNYLGIDERMEKFKKTELITLASGAFRKSCKSLHLFGQ